MREINFDGIKYSDPLIDRDATKDDYLNLATVVVAKRKSCEI